MGRLTMPPKRKRVAGKFHTVDRVWERRQEADGTYRYLTSWKGFDEKTWEPIDHFNEEALAVVRELELILDQDEPKPQWLLDYEEEKARDEAKAATVTAAKNKQPSRSSSSSNHMNARKPASVAPASTAAKTNQPARRPTAPTPSTTSAVNAPRKAQKKSSSTAAAPTTTTSTASSQASPAKKNKFGKKTNKNAVDEEEADEQCVVCNPANPRHADYPSELKRELNEREFDWDGLYCDGCGDFFHAGCVDREDYETTYTDKFICPQCTTATLKSTLYEVVAPHRYNFHEREEVGKPAQIGSKTWMDTRFPIVDKQIKAPTPREMRSEYRIVHYNNGHEFKANFDWENQEWKNVYLIRKKDGLGLRVPRQPYGVDDVIKSLKADWPVRTVDVHTQHARFMTLGRYKELQSVPPADRQRLYNILSLEITDTDLFRIITPPLIYKELSLVEKAHRSADHKRQFNSWKYYVQRFCLLSMGGSFTDFHIDFGGSSVWYHVHSGQKVFYLVPPTKRNLDIFEELMSSQTRDERFFGDLVDRKECWKLVIHEGETAMIPAGWIHAVYTPVDSVVFGGNFVTMGGIRMQLEIGEFEKRQNIDVKFRFPQFRFVHWIAARRMTRKLQESKKDDKPLADHFLVAARALYGQLVKWTEEVEDEQTRRDREETYDSIVSDPADTIENLRKAILSVTGETEVQPVEDIIDRGIFGRVRREEGMDDEEAENKENEEAARRTTRRSSNKAVSTRAETDNKRKSAVAPNEAATAKRARKAGEGQ